MLRRQGKGVRLIAAGVNPHMLGLLRLTNRRARIPRKAL
jgi:hypothetical protein